MKKNKVEDWLQNIDPLTSMGDFDEAEGCYSQLECVTKVMTDAGMKGLVPQKACGLILCDHSHALALYELTEPRVTVGRDAGCSVRIDDQYLSAEHFVISKSETLFVIEDCGSKNKVCVNSVKIDSRMLVDGDYITAGLSAFLFVDNRGS